MLTRIIIICLLYTSNPKIRALNWRASWRSAILMQGQVGERNQCIGNGRGCNLLFGFIRQRLLATGGKCGIVLALYVLTSNERWCHHCSCTKHPDCGRCPICRWVYTGGLELSLAKKIFYRAYMLLLCEPQPAQHGLLRIGAPLLVRFGCSLCRENLLF